MLPHTGFLMELRGILRRLCRLRADCIFFCFLHSMQKKRHFRAAKMQSVLRQLRWLRAPAHFFWHSQKLRCFAPRPSYDGKMFVVEPRRISRDPRRHHKKYRPLGRHFYGGAEGNRTPVRKQLDRTFFGRSLLFTFPCRSGNKHSHRLSRVIMHGRVNSFPPHGHHSDHTLARLVVLPGRMGA